jgi:hypothetical protein
MAFPGVGNESIAMQLWKESCKGPLLQMYHIRKEKDKIQEQLFWEGLRQEKKGKKKGIARNVFRTMPA